MKKAIIPMAATAILLASCDTGTKDSYQQIPYPEYNLIVDTQDETAPAVASYGNYDLKFNISKNCIDIKASEIIFNNQQYSFETDTMAVRQKAISVDGGTIYNLTFSKSGNAGSNGVGSAASDLRGSLVYCYLIQNGDLLNPSLNLGVTERLDLSYTLNGRYSVQTFWPAAYYQGQSVATSDAGTYSTKNSGYLTQINFEKKTASVYLYNAEFSAEEGKSLPKVIRFEDVPVVFSHTGFTLESAAPKTTVLGKKDNQTALVDSVGFGATDFRLDIISADLTDINITYRLDGHHVNFRGSSIVK